MRIRPKESFLLAEENAALQKLTDLSLNRADSEARSPHNLAQVERLVRTREKKRENGPTHPPEQHSSCFSR
jgi:hypothetical protein